MLCHVRIDLRDREIAQERDKQGTGCNHPDLFWDAHFAGMQAGRLVPVVNLLRIGPHRDDTTGAAAWLFALEFSEIKFQLTDH